MLEPLQFPFFQRALVAGLLASIACGVVGTYVVVKRIASISGGLSHAAFGGVGLGYLLGFDPMLGAMGFALAGGFGIGIVYRRIRSGLDTLIAMVWSVGMALGIVFVSLTPGYAPDLMSYLFGSILFAPAKFVAFIAGLDVVILVVVTLLFREFQSVCFDEEHSEVMGLRVGLILQVLLALVALVVVTLIRVVGVILVIALLTVPAVVARQWSDSLAKMMVLASIIGAACSTAGLFLSYWLAASFEVNVPTGPLIILLAVFVYAASSLLRWLLDPSRRHVRTATAVVVLGLCTVNCGNSPPPPDKPVIVVSVAPQAFFVERIAGDRVEVEVMVPPGANPATHSPTLQQMKAVSEAAVYFKVGHAKFPFEKAWLDRLMDGNRRVVVVDGSLGIPSDEGDPHIWVSPGCVRTMARNLEAALEPLLPDDSEALRQNLRDFEREIDALDTDVRESLKAFSGRRFLVFHPAWGYFAKEYGLEQVPIQHHGKEPSAAGLAELIDLARMEGVRVIFVQPQFSRESAEAVASEVGAQVVAVDPLGRNWLQTMDTVAGAFRDAFRRQDARD